jgi:PKD repeat protein
MKKFTLLLGLMIISWLGFSQTTINYQDFEADADDWNYTAYPAPYNVSGDTWDTVTDFSSHISGPQSGNYFWGMRDLDNGNGGGAFRHTLTFDAIDVSTFSDVNILFYYYTDGFDGSDSIFYNVQYNDGSDWPEADDVELEKNTDSWTSVAIDVPDGTQYVRLQLSARQNGGSDYAGFDNVVLQSGGGGGGGTTTINVFYEPFDADLNVMQVHNIVGDQEWEWANYGNPPGSAKMNGYSGGAQDNEDWLITPVIDLDGISNPTLHFDHARNYNNNDGLYVLISNDYDGVSDPNTSGTWNDITSDFTFPDPGSWSFIDAGTVDISSYAGVTTYIAYKYTSTTDGAATWEVDNITVAYENASTTAALTTFMVYDTAGQNYDGFNLKGTWDVAGNYDPTWNGDNEHTPFYDDGTHGDETAGDHIWTCQQNLEPDNGANTWEWGVNDTEHNWVDGNWQFTVPNMDPQTLTWEVPSEPALIINEIMYNSPGADEEWIELYNNTGASIDLENWKVLDNDASHDAIVIPAGYSIDADGYFTIQISDNGNFPFTPDYNGSGNFSLGNGGDAVRLWNADGYLVDIVVYDDASPWPTEPDGDGPTLALIDPEYDNSLAGSWLASNEDGGTPGAVNFPPEPFIKVLNPNGGESIQQGSTYTIEWNYGYWDGDIQIDLFHGDNDSLMLVSGIPASDSTWDWYVFDDQELDTNYKIKIKGIDPGSPSDMSDESFSIIAPYISPNLVITEIMYNPPESGEDSLEFVELYNNSMDTIDLEGLYFSEGIEYTFPSQTMLPDTFVVVAKDSLAMLEVFGINVQQWTSGSLKNSGEKVELRDKVDNVVDSLTYDDAAPWPTEPDGDGPSLTLCDPELDNSLGENWHASEHFMAVNADGDSIWATPGFECQISLLAAFEADTTTVLVGDSVHFTDASTGNPTSWDWTFEGGSPGSFSGQTPPAVAYDTAGHWDVTLVIGDGSTYDTAFYEEFIWAGETPVADFEAFPTTFVAGSYTNYTSLSSGDSLTFDWNFEGATPDTSIDENPQEIYYLINADSLYDVTLIVTNVFGSDTMTKEEYIHTTPEGIEDNAFGAQIVLYPNPSDGIVYITLAQNGNFEVSVVDLAGRIVYSDLMTSSGKIDLSQMEKGVYLIKVTDSNNGLTNIKRLLLK